MITPGATPPQDLIKVGQSAAFAKTWVTALCILMAPVTYRSAAAANHAVIWNFSGGIDGNSPRGDLLIDATGAAYGTTSVGGASANGAVFKIVVTGTGSGTDTTLWSFTGGTDGSLPSAGLVEDSSGELYGTTAMDGAGTRGTVFKLTPPAAGHSEWTETTLWSFGFGADGRTPVGSLLLAGDGSLYGTTTFGGAHNQGAVFRLAPPQGSGPWTETLLWSFAGGADGAQPAAALVMDASGKLYGTTKAGGSSGVGTVFQLAHNGISGSWTQATLWAFTGGGDGAAPTSTLVFDAGGALYGTTNFGGDTGGVCAQARYPYYGEPNSRSRPAFHAAYVGTGGNGCGVVFRLTPPAGGFGAWTQSVIWRFKGKLDGANPAAGVVFGTSGALYGIATEYGAPNSFWGAADKFLAPAGKSQAWSEVTLAGFAGKIHGAYPRSGLTQGPDGKVYGTTTVGGSTWRHVSVLGYGTLFSTLP